jgi:hypothetical protein
MQVQIRSLKLKSRSHSEWAQRIELIANLQLRGKVACIVWWDYAKNDWPDHRAFAPTFDRGSDSDALDVRLALKGIGYSAKAARLRSRVPKTWEMDRKRRLRMQSLRQVEPA